MNKKIIGFLIFIAFTILLIFVISNKYLFFKPKTTGAILINPPSEEIELGEAISNLQARLPLNLNYFIITNYDYSKGKFIVKANNNKVNIYPDFENWLKASEYKSIPTNMFLISI